MPVSTAGCTASSRKRPERGAALAALLVALVAVPARGQAGADSSRAADAAPPPAPASDPTEIPYPARDRALDVAALLGALRGSFLYDFGTPGWPDGWSPLGLDPRSVAVELDGIPFEDPVTGAPVWELVPMAQIEPLRSSSLSRGRTDVIRADFRRAFPVRPLTEMRYRSASGGLQAVDVTHAQRRTVGRTGVSVVLGYGGAGSAGEYDGSRLRRKRRLLGRVDLSRGAWSYGLADLYNSHRVGAHGGVLPLPGLGYESIYNRLLGQVEDPSAERSHTRNDLVLSATGPLAGAALSARAWRTTSTLEYRNDVDTTVARVERIGVLAEWPVPGWPVSVRLSAHTDAVRSGNAFAGRPARTWTASLALDLDRTLGAWHVEASGGLQTFAGHSRLSAHLSTSRSVGALEVRAAAVLAHVPRSAAELHGFGPTFSGLAGAGPTRNARVEAGLALRVRALRIDLTGFYRNLDDAHLLWLDTSGDTLRLATPGGFLDHPGLVVSAGLRDDAPRGIYLAGSVTWNARSSSGSPLVRIAREAVPEGHGQARAGVRAGLFGGDLVADLAVQARAWTGTGGLRLHTPTGLLALPEASSRPLPGSAIVDVTVDARIRSATVFLAMENVLSGTKIVTGNQLVPDYPYPERRFRFGVYWPIMD